MTQDPYPQDLDRVDDAALGFAPSDPTVKALNRIATALEQLVLNKMDSQPAANQPALAALPPIQVAGGCPTHNQPWKIVPAGISKKTGNPYDSFAACPVSGCDQRPPKR